MKYFHNQMLILCVGFILSNEIEFKKYHLQGKVLNFKCRNIAHLSKQFLHYAPS